MQVENEHASARASFVIGDQKRRQDLDGRECARRYTTHLRLSNASLHRFYRTREAESRLGRLFQRVAQSNETLAILWCWDSMTRKTNLKGKC